MCALGKLIRNLPKKDCIRETYLIGINAAAVTDGSALPADLSPWYIYVLRHWKESLY